MFRPCIDLHEGKVKQLVGGTLGGSAEALRTNFVSEKSSAEYAALYRRDGLSGGHVILLGPGNEQAASDVEQKKKTCLHNCGLLNQVGRKSLGRAGSSLSERRAHRNSSASSERERTFCRFGARPPAFRSLRV